MTVAIACPKGQDFERLAAGDAGAEQMEQFATHVEQCQECARRMDAVGDQSLLVKALRAEPLQWRDATHLAPLMAELEKLADPFATAASHTPNPAASEISTDPGVQAGFDDTEIDLSKLLAPAQEPGELGRLGAYRVLKILGAGGMGVVFQAEDTVLKRRVALKAMRPEFAASASLRQRFLREAQAAAAVHHDHVVVIHFAGEESGVAFLTMELLEGESLEARLRRAEGGCLPLAETLRIGREIAEGLAAAHELGLIHRDIKPNNIWLQNGRARVKILDFGLARATDRDGQLTSAGAIVGTPAYMSPEQANAEPVDFRTDLFSLGCVLYRMTTGVLPFAGDSAVKTLRAVVEHQPKSPREINPAVPAELSALVMRLLEKDCAKRPESAHEIAVEIAAIDHAPAAVTSQPKVAPRGSRGLSWAIAALLLAILGGYWMYQVVIIRDRNGEEVARIKVPEGGSAEIVKDKRDGDNAKGKDEIPPKPTKAIATGESMSPLALVSKPAKIAGVKSWTIETIERRGGEGPGGPEVFFRPDGRRVATWGQDGIIRIWDAKNGELIRALVGKEREVPYRGRNSVAWSRDGKFIACAGHYGHVQVWAEDSGKYLWSTPIGGELYCICWSPDGKAMAVGGSSGHIRLLGANGEVHDSLKAEGHVFSLAWSPHGEILASSDSG